MYVQVSPWVWLNEGCVAHSVCPWRISLEFWPCVGLTASSAPGPWFRGRMPGATTADPPRMRPPGLCVKRHLLATWVNFAGQVPKQKTKRGKRRRINDPPQAKWPTWPSANLDPDEMMAMVSTPAIRTLTCLLLPGQGAKAITWQTPNIKRSSLPRSGP